MEVIRQVPCIKMTPHRGWWLMKVCWALEVSANGGCWQRMIITTIALAIDWALTIYQARHLALYLCLSHLIFATTPRGRYSDHPSYTDRELRIEEVERGAWVQAEGGSGSRFVHVQSPWPGPWIGLVPSKIVKLVVFLKCGFRAVHLFTSLRLSSHPSLRDSTPPCPSSHTFLPSITLPPSHTQIQTHLHCVLLLDVLLKNWKLW